MRHTLTHCAIIAAACLAVYWTSLSGAFVWDDETQLVKNPNLRSIANVPDAFTTGFWSFASGGANQNNFYRPVQTVLYTLGYAAGELSPRAYHSISLGLHIAASLAVYWLCLELGIGLWALPASILFAVHPVHTEAVAWIAGMPDVACGAFYFGSAVAYLRWLKGADKRWLAASCALFLASLLSKEMAATLPVVLLLLRPEQWKKLAPLAGTLVVYLAMRVNALGFLTVDQAQASASAWDWLTLGVWAWGAYVWYAIVPYPLSAYHTVPLHFADRVTGTAVAAAALIAITIVLWRWKKLRGNGLRWALCFTAMLVPVFYFPGISTALIAERYLYIPSIVAALAIVRLGNAAWGVAAVYAYLTFAHVPVWANNEAMYRATIERSPDAAHIRLNLASVFLDRGDQKGAREQTEAALATFATGKYAQTKFDRYRGAVAMGVLENDARNFAAARQHWEEAIALYPEGDWAHLYLGRLKLEVDLDSAGAIAEMRRAVQANAVNEVARDYLGIALFNQGDYRGAIAAFEDALRVNPSYAIARQHLNQARDAQRKQETRPAP